MKDNTNLLTLSQAADVLRINENTINALVYTGQIPHMRTSAGGTQQICFNIQAIDSWLGFGPMLTIDNHAYIERMKNRLPKRYPQAFAVLREFDKQFSSPHKPKGYNLSKVKNKKLGFVYYVRYIEKGKLVPTRWSTHTNSFEAATRFAIENKNRLLCGYYQNKTRKKPSNSLYTIMRRYYEKDSPYQVADTRRGRIIAEQTRNYYYHSILNHWIPFLKRQRIKSLDEIDTPLMARFQDYCMDKGAKPQSVNHYVCFVSRIFDYLVLRGYVEKNPCNELTALGVPEESVDIRSCYKTAELKGIFNKRWDDDISYLLCLVIYTTGMRNSEIDRIKVKDIIQRGKFRFIDIPKSKSRYGVRQVPLHDFVYGKLARYIRRHNKGPENLLFCLDNGKALSRKRYIEANAALGAVTKYGKDRLEKENITFYSGRHFWKTMMNENGLGDVEEYFMGHKVTNDVAERYNHRDKQGQKNIIRKAYDVFRILERTLFTQRRSRQRSRS